MVEALKDANLRLYFSGRFISSLGNQFSFFAQSVAAYVLTGHLSSVGLLWLLRGISSLLFIPIGGAVADRYDRKKVILASDFTSGLLAFCYVAINSSNALWLLPTLAFFSQAVNRFFDPAAAAAFKHVSQHVPLEKSNAFNASLGQISIILGPLLASLAYYLSSGNIHLLFIGDGLSFIISFSFMLFVFFGQYGRGLLQKDHFFTDIAKGFHHIADQPSLLCLILLIVPWV